jgi:site-specific DNA-methyltransferase (adenine-specific)/modification methylase
MINQIICGDCLEVMKQIPDKSIDLVLTDPPYNISQKGKIFRDYRNGKNGDINMDFGEWDYNFQPELYLIEMKRVLVDNGSVIVWTSEQLYGIYRKWFAENMYPKQLLVWKKTNPLPQFRLVGYRQATELMFWALKNKNTTDNPNFIFHTQKEMTNVFTEPIVGGKERTKHPTQKPLSIALKITSRHCRENGVILDPFLGSGTTAVAAKMLGRRYIGIEISPEYCKIARKRIENTGIQEEMKL